MTTEPLNRLPPRATGGPSSGLNGRCANSTPKAPRSASSSPRRRLAPMALHPTRGAQQIEALRDRGPVRTDSAPARQRASEASLRQRLQSLRDENQRLREESHSLKTELALAYGQQRDARSR